MYFEQMTSANLPPQLKRLKTNEATDRPMISATHDNLLSKSLSKKLDSSKTTDKGHLSSLKMPIQCKRTSNLDCPPKGHLESSPLNGNFPLNGLHGLLSSSYLSDHHRTHHHLSPSSANQTTSGSAFGAYLPHCNPHMYSNETAFHALNGFAAGLDAITYAQQVSAAAAAAAAAAVTSSNSTTADGNHLSLNNGALIKPSPDTSPPLPPSTSTPYTQPALINTAIDELSCASSACSPNSTSLGYSSGSPGAYSADSTRSSTAGSTNDGVLTNGGLNHRHVSRSANGSMASPGLPGSTATSKRTRRRIATVAQRRAANIRERRRMLYLNTAFDKLRKNLPCFPYEKRLSRIDTLKLAVFYIKFMIETVDKVPPVSSPPGSTNNQQSPSSSTAACTGARTGYAMHNKLVSAHDSSASAGPPFASANSSFVFAQTTEMLPKHVAEHHQDHHSHHQHQSHSHPLPPPPPPHPTPPHQQHHHHLLNRNESAKPVDFVSPMSTFNSCWPAINAYYHQNANGV